jgi:ABC-2 type transport system ATP-binding protein
MNMKNNPTIYVSNVSKRFGKTTVLSDINLNIGRGEIFGLLGPSGAGKTTLVKMIAGIDTSTSGEISVMETIMPNFTILPSIGFMAQSDALYEELTALENLDFFGSLYGLRGNLKKQRIKEVMTLVNLIEELKKPVSQYSGGMKRRLSLAAAILHSPPILILDEPTVGIDPVLRKSIWNELKIIAQHGTTILVTTHVMDEADKCDRLGMIRDGRLIATGTPSELKHQTNSQTIEDAFLHFGGAKL